MLLAVGCEFVGFCISIGLIAWGFSVMLFGLPVTFSLCGCVLMTCGCCSLMFDWCYTSVVSLVVAVKFVADWFAD